MVPKKFIKKKGLIYSWQFNLPWNFSIRRKLTSKNLFHRLFQFRYCCLPPNLHPCLTLIKIFRFVITSKLTNLCIYIYIYISCTLTTINIYACISIYMYVPACLHACMQYDTIHAHIYIYTTILNRRKYIYQSMSHPIWELRGWEALEVTFGMLMYFSTRLAIDHDELWASSLFLMFWANSHHHEDL